MPETACIQLGSERETPISGTPHQLTFGTGILEGVEKLTLDTDALRDLLENRARGIKAMHEISKLVDEGKVEWAVTKGFRHPGRTA